MIFVVLGTITIPFFRPLKEIESLVKKGVIKEEVIVQAGHTNFESDYLNISNYFDKDCFDKNYADASFIISHAGVGSIMNGLRFNKKIIVIARRKKYKEHINDHQLEISSTFSSKGYILSWHEHDNLMDVIDRLVTFIPRKYPFFKGRISETIIDFLENNF